MSLLQNRKEKTDLTKEAYIQTCEDFRALNKIMWQIPVLAMTLTGGAWFGVSKAEGNQMIELLLFFVACTGCIGFAISLIRLRTGVMEKLLLTKSKVEGFQYPDPNRYTIIFIFCTILVMTGLVSAIMFTYLLVQLLMPTPI